jgi:hypothetical protein
MQRVKRGRFPYELVAKLWEEAKTISEITEQIGRVDTKREDGDKDPPSYLSDTHACRIQG